MATDGTSKREGVALLVVPQARSERDDGARLEGAMRLAEFEIRIRLPRRIEGTKPKGTAPSSDGEEEDGDGRGARSKRSSLGRRWRVGSGGSDTTGGVHFGHHRSPVTTVTVTTPDAFATVRLTSNQNPEMGASISEVGPKKNFIKKHIRVKY